MIEFVLEGIQIHSHLGGVLDDFEDLLLE